MNDEHHLIEGYLDGELTTDQEGRLTTWLAADPEHMKLFVRETWLHRQLRQAMLARSYRAYGLSEAELTRRAPTKARLGTLGGNLRNWFGLPWSLAQGGAFAAVALCLVLVTVVGWYLGPTTGEPFLAEVHGAGLSLERAGQPLAASPGVALSSGDVLRTPANVVAVISYVPEMTRLTLQPATEFKLAAPSRGKRFSLVAGTIVALVARQRPFRPLVLRTPHAEARVLGIKFTLAVTTNATRLDVAEGEVRLTRVSDGARVDVPGNHYAIAASEVRLAALPRTGGILREYWTNLPGTSMTELEMLASSPRTPDGHDYLTNFEATPNWGDNYGARFRGYVHPPVTGDYTFWIAGNDILFLFLSSDDNPANKIRVASIEHTKPRQWDRPAQPSGPLFQQQTSFFRLQAGRRYYIEALLKAGKGEDHLAVAWRGPGREREIIPGEFLSPFKLKK